MVALATSTATLTITDNDSPVTGGTNDSTFAPVFIPMFLLLGFSPEGTQVIYLIGDSSTNIITPLMPYFPLVVVYAQKYVKKTGIGTMISLMPACGGPSFDVRQMR